MDASIFDALATDNTGSMFDGVDNGGLDFGASTPNFQDVPNEFNTMPSENAITGSDFITYKSNSYSFDRLDLEKLNRKPVKTYTQSKAEISKMTAEEKQRRIDNSKGFAWVQTLIDKEIWIKKETKKKGTIDALKNAHLLRWVCTTRRSDGNLEYFTTDELLSYFTQHCDFVGSFIFGDETTDDALKLSVTFKESKDANAFGNDIKPSIVISPASPNIKSKFDKSKIVPAKQQVFLEDGVTPKRERNVRINEKKLAELGITKDEIDINNPLHADFFHDVYELKAEYKGIISRQSPERKRKKQEADRFSGAAFLNTLYGC